jgi:opacity protein-like surface antigen
VRPHLFALLGLALLASSCSAVGPAAYAKEQRLLLTYYRITTDEYHASGDLNAATGFLNEGDPDLDGWDAQLDVDMSFGNVVAGYSDREYGNFGRAEEWFGGMKWWLGGTGKNTYFMVVGRYADELTLKSPSSPVNGDAYYGYGVGGGVTAQMTENIFLDFKVLYERLIGGVDIGPDEVQLSGLVGSFGIGVLF